MLELPGYNIQKVIFESGETRVFRAFRNDNMPVIIKQYYNDNHYPYKSEEASVIYHEYQVNKKLMNQQGVIQVYEFLPGHDFPVIVMEDIKGESLADILKFGKIHLPDFLNLSIQLADAIDKIHNENIIHKDINPTNIIWNREKNIVRIIDFGIATEFPREITSAKNPNALEGTLAYISPEQTGRMNHALDYRTDFYSLGITLYQMITGTLPFESNDLLQIVHSHIAIQPVPPHEIEESLPEAISAIIMKLVAKNVEDRYQSAHGLKADLERCKKDLENSGVIGSFSLGSQDVSGKFQIPQKLYGREKEIETLLLTFERTSESNTELLLVSGFPGIGKSVLVREIQKSIVKRRGNFISGKFEKLKKGIPYSAFIQAFSDFASQILAGNDLEIKTLKDKILSALGPNGKIITDVIPLFKSIIGEQQDVPELGPVESQNRFNLVFQRFTGVLSSKEHPLVIFLDDLQWSDSASLQLLKLIATNSEIRSLLIIGTYRHNETPDSHPLILTLDEIAKSGVAINNIFLNPLTVENARQLLTDTFNSVSGETEFLAELIVQKTSGNPFFMHEFLKSLYKKQLIEFSFENGWSWKINEMRNIQATDNVVNFLTDKITELSENTQKVLKQGACIGNGFSMSDLVMVCGKEDKDILSALNEVLQEGIIIKIDDIYRFNHDRVREAVYSLISEKERIEYHHLIGNLALKNFTQEELQKNIFFIVNHLNSSLPLVKKESEKLKLAELNLNAGEKALSSNAYESALDYLKIGIKLLPGDSWQNNYDLTLELYQNAVRAAQLDGKYMIMDNLTEDVLRNAGTVLDTLQVYETKIHACAARSQFLEGIKTGLDILASLGIHMPVKPGKLKIIFELMRVKFVLKGKTIKDIINLPEMSEQRKLGSMRIISGMASSVYLGSPDLLPLLIFNSVKLSVKYGNNCFSPYFFAALGMIYCGILGDINTGFEYGKLAIELVDKFNIKMTMSRVQFLVYYFVFHWKLPQRECFDLLLGAYKIGLETGDHEYAALSAGTYATYLFHTGVKLDFVEKETFKYVDSIRKINQNTILNYQLINHQTILNFQGKSENPSLLIGSSYNINKMLPVHKKAGDNSAFLFLYFYSLYLNYYFENYTEALKNAELIKPYRENQISHPFLPISFFYDSLTRLALYHISNGSVKRKLLRIVVKNQKKMKKWAGFAPENYKHKCCLVEAEIARVRRQEQKARKHYILAIKLAHKNKFLHEEALSCELYAKFWLGQKENKIAILYLTEARNKYRKWGADAKVKYLEKKYNNLLNINIGTDPGSVSIPGTTGTSSSEVMDMATIIKTSQTLSGEMDLDSLLKTMIISSIENAGAQRGFLILANIDNNNLSIEAEVEVDKEPRVLESVPVKNSNKLSTTIVNYVFRTGENVVLNNAFKEGNFTNNPYVVEKEVKSLLCFPISRKGKIIGILYMENNITIGCFTEERIELLKILSSQAAISIENARLYENLEEQVAQRTRQLEEANQKLKELSLNDPLTSLRNRRYIYEFVSELSDNFIKNQVRLLDSREKRDLPLKGKVLGFYLIDIDYFKSVNDTYGHKVGDIVLVEISRVLKKAVRSDDIVVRWGGEEFLIILKYTRPEFLKVFSKRLLEIIRNTEINISDKMTMHKTCSLGCSKFPINPDEPDFIGLEQTINICDFALYMAKENGRNRAVHINLKERKVIDERARTYLSGLSRYMEVDNEYIDIEYIH